MPSVARADLMVMVDAVEAQQAELNTERGAMQKLADECERLKRQLASFVDSVEARGPNGKRIEPAQFYVRLNH